MKFKDEKGYMAVEATIIFPVVLLCTIAMLLVSVYLLEKAMLQTSAEIALTYYKNSMTDTYVGVKNMQYGDEYNSGSALDAYNTSNVFRVFMVPTGSEEKDKFTNIFESVYGHESIRNGSIKIEEFKISGVLFYKYIDVTLTDEINIPINLSLVGIKDTTIKHKVKLRTTVNDPDQFIRDFDIAKEFVMFFVKRNDIDDKIEEITSKFVSFYNKYLKP